MGLIMYTAASNLPTIINLPNTECAHRNLLIDSICPGAYPGTQGCIYCYDRVNAENGVHSGSSSEASHHAAAYVMGLVSFSTAK